MSHQILNLSDINWFSVSDIDWSKLWSDIISRASNALTELLNWVIEHPYVAAGAVLCIAAFANPNIILTPLRLLGEIALFICILPLMLVVGLFRVLGISIRFIMRNLGFTARGVKKTSLASQYQSHRYGGNVPRNSTFSQFQSYGATGA